MKIIAETASNHMGELSYLKELSLKSHEAGADIITVQVLNLEAFVTSFDKLSYPNFAKVYLKEEQWIDYFNWCTERTIEVLPCILDFPSAEFCLKQGFKDVKIHASDIMSLNFLKYVNDSFDKVFLEFGGANLDEIGKAFELLKDTEVVLLYGFNSYPTKIENQNLNFLESLTYLFKCDTGFADHSVNNELIPLLAMAKGASYLEKHVTLDSKNENRFDWQVSVEPKVLKSLVDRIHEYMPSFGDQLRVVSDCEKNFRKLVYKKIVAKRKLVKGEVFKMQDIDLKRSIDGLEASYIEKVIGREVKIDIEFEEPITLKKLVYKQ